MKGQYIIFTFTSLADSIGADNYGTSGNSIAGELSPPLL